MKVGLLITLNKLLTFICKIFKKNGSVFPGSIVFSKLDRHILEKIEWPKHTIVVTGSSGKGSTVSLLANIFKANKIDFVYNASGSNAVRAIATLVLNNCNFNGKFKHDVLLLEMDERHLKMVFTKYKPEYVIITNITRDQPVRNGEPEDVYNEIMSPLDKRTTIIANADDPLVNRCFYTHKGKVITYGLAKTTNSFKKHTILATDYGYCPLCHKKLIYDFYHYGHIGNYKCPTCNFKRNVTYEGTKVNLDKQIMNIDNNLLFINKNVLYAAYYTLAAYVLCKTFGLNEDKIIKAINDKNVVAKTGKSTHIDGRLVTMLESKNENNLSYYQSLRYIKDQKRTKSVILGFENVSRRYKENDLSWLWDVEFELLNDSYVDKIFCIGRFKYDILTRLQYAKIDSKKLVLIDDLNTLIKKVKILSKGEVYTMVCFDMTEIIRNLIKEDEHENN